MIKHLGYVTILVKDYDEAIAFYPQAMRFHLVEDTTLGEGKRWVRVAPKNHSSTSLPLAKAATEAQVNRIGNQTGGRVFLFLHTDDFWRDHHAMRSRDVHFTERPRQEA